MIQLSYIIPAYNASAYIRHTLDSIFALPLTTDDYEIIVVDDSSTDDSIEVLHDIQQSHPNLTILQQETNQRQGAARNRGIDMARGEYIAFCDADDMVVAEGVINALQSVEKSHADICYFDFEYEHPNGEWVRFEMPEATHNTIMSSDEYLNNYYTCYYNAPWRCLYKTDFLRRTGIRFEEGVRWEDCDWTVKVYANADKIQFVDGVGYRYAWNDAATSRQADAQAMAEQIKAGCRLVSFAKEIEHLLPGFSKTIFHEAKSRYVIQNIRLRNLTKYNVSNIISIYKKVNAEEWKLLKTLHLPIWETLVVKHHLLTLIILGFACPLAAIGRKMVALKRKIK